MDKDTNNLLSFTWFSRILKFERRTINLCTVVGCGRYVNFKDVEVSGKGEGWSSWSTVSPSRENGKSLGFLLDPVDVS